jgi:endonuclease/exonuclease/phosphatase (EEP) superfamily protein YafD
VAILAGVLSTLAIAVTGLILARRLTDADRRRRGAVRLASFNELLIMGAIAPWAVFDLLRLIHVVHLPAAAASNTLEALPAITGVLAIALAGPAIVRPIGVVGKGAEVDLLTINIERDSSHAGAIAERVLELDPDLLLIQEYTPSTRDACLKVGLVGAYPHVWEDATEGWFGCAVLSRFPIMGSEVREIGERPMGVVVLQVAGQRVTVVNVHVQAPIYPRDIVPWNAAFDDLTSLAEATEGPVIMAGDWNATGTHPPMRDLLRSGTLRDAHRNLRRWLPRTWPTGKRYPPLLCLDHVLVSPTIEVLGASEVTVEGTDHRALLVGLRMP